jgi:hypothetical protein
MDGMHASKHGVDEGNRWLQMNVRKKYFEILRVNVGLEVVGGTGRGYKIWAKPGSDIGP